MTLGDTLRHLTRPSTDRTDGELLAGFVRTRDESAFAELLQRHGPMVYGVCRRVLGDSADADDAFQAVFLVLVRKAGSIRPPGMVGNWLYGVAVRTANKAQAMKAKRASRDLRFRLSRAVGASGSTAFGGDDVTEIIDEELAALPAVYRAAFVACELNGRTRSEAAKELGWPEGTLASRLAKARELLAARLTKRGVTLATGAFSAVVVPPALAAETLTAVREFIAVGAASSVSPAAQQLSNTVVKSMGTFKLKLLAVGMLAVALAVGTATLVAGPEVKPEPRTERKLVVDAPVDEDTPPNEWKEIGVLEHKGQLIHSVAFHPDGKTLATGGSGGKVTLWDSATRKELGSAGLPDAAPFTGVAFDSKGEKLAATCKKGARLFDPKLKGELKLQFQQLKGAKFSTESAHAAAFLQSADEERLIITDGQHTQSGLRVKDSYEVKSGNEGVLGYQGRPAILAAFGDGSRYLSFYHGIGEFRTTAIAAIESTLGKKPTFIELPVGPFGNMIAGAVAGEDKHILTGDDIGGVYLWQEDEDNAKVWKIARQWNFTTDASPARVLSVCLNRDGTQAAALVITASKDQKENSHDVRVFVWPTDENEMPAAICVTPKSGTFDGLGTVAFSPDGKMLAAAVANKNDMKLKIEVPVEPGGLRPAAEDVANENYVKEKDRLGQVRLFALPERKRNAPVPKAVGEWKEGKPITFEPDPHGDRITGIAYDPMGKFIAVAVGNQVRLLDAATRKQVNEHALTAKAPATVTGVAFSPDGKTLAMTAKDNVFLYTELGKSPSASSDTSWKTEGLDAHQVTWLTADALVASNGAEASWRYKQGDKLPFTSINWKWPGGKRGQPQLLAAIPEQSMMLLTSGHNEKEGNEVHVATAPPLASPQSRLSGKGHKFSPVVGAASADGKRIVTADEGGTLIVWEGEKFAFKEKSRVELGKGVVQLALAPDGKTVAVVRAFVDTKLLGTSGRTLFNLELSVFDATSPPKELKPLWAMRDVLADKKEFTGPASLAFSPDGKTLLAAFADPYIVDKDFKSMGVKVWELKPAN